MNFKILIILLFPAMLFCQTAKSDLLQLNFAYNTYHKISYATKYSMYNILSGEFLESYTISYKKNANNYLTSSQDEEMLVNASYIVIADKEDKEIHIRRNKPTEDNSINKMLNDKTNMPLYMDTLMSVYKSVTPLKALLPATRAYKFELYQGEYSAVDLVIDTKNWLIREMTLYPVEPTEFNNKEVKVKLKVEYINYNLNPVFGQEFSETKYLEKIQGKFKLKPIYSNYRLYDETF